MDYQVWIKISKLNCLAIIWISILFLNSNFGHRPRPTRNYYIYIFVCLLSII